MDSLKQDIFNLDVVDMHNQLDIDPTTESVVAKDFWDIGEYFWVRRHLWSAGYPVEAESMSFDERAKHYVKALDRAQNTIWVRALKQGVKELYGMELKDLNSVYELQDIITAKSKQKHYGMEIADKVKLKSFVVNGNGAKKFGELEDKAIHVESVEVSRWAKALLAGEDVQAGLDELFKQLKAKKVTGVRTTINRMNGFTYTQQLIKENMSYDDAIVAVLHYISAACEKYGMFVQLFMGVANDVSKIPGPFNDGEGIAKLYGIFEKYNCTYSIITASQAQNIDVINAANVFSNVQADGLWWYNLRPSSYKEMFEMRLEELPSIRSSIVASDAYVIEWCYIKMNIIKNTLYEFMKGEIEKGHIDREMAMKVASDWLSGSAVELFEGRK